MFNTLVWFGIKLAKWFGAPSQNEKSNPNEIVFISETRNDVIEKVLKKDIQVISQFDSYKNDTEYILDNKSLSFKSIIDILSNTPKNCTATYKILPKNSNFIIGSNSSKSRGEVISF